MAGLTQAQLEGGELDPSTRGDDAYGLVCGKDGIGIMTCAVSGIVRTEDLELVHGMVPTKVTFRGKLAQAISAGLPQTSPAGMIGAWSSGHEPSKIECTGTSDTTSMAPWRRVSSRSSASESR